MGEKKNPGNKVIVLAGRCLRCDEIFYDIHRKNGNIKKPDAVLHTYLTRYVPLPDPDRFIYLKSSVDVCMRRKEMCDRECVRSFMEELSCGARKDLSRERRQSHCYQQRRRYPTRNPQHSRKPCRRQVYGPDSSPPKCKLKQSHDIPN